MIIEKTIEADKLSLPIEKEVKKTVKFLGRLKMQRGQKLFELNTKTMWIDVIDITDSAVSLNGSVHKKVVLKENCLYTPALNLKNAERKFIKMLQ